METEQSTPKQTQEPLTSKENSDWSAEYEQSFKEGSRLLSEFLNTELESKQNLERILAEYLREKPVTTETAVQLLNSLSRYAGYEKANFLLTLLKDSVEEEQFQDEKSKKFLTLVQESFDEKTWTFIRTLLALYGDAVSEAFYLQGGNPNGWQSLTARVNQEMITGQWLISLSLTKYNRENTLYEESPSHLLILVNTLLEALNYIPAEAAPATISQDDIDKFRHTYSEFLKLYAQSENSE